MIPIDLKLNIAGNLNLLPLLPLEKKNRLKYFSNYYTFFLEGHDRCCETKGNCFHNVSCNLLALPAMNKLGFLGVFFKPVVESQMCERLCLPTASASFDIDLYHYSV